MASSPIASSSRFEELPPSPTSSTHSFHSTQDDPEPAALEASSSSSAVPLRDHEPSPLTESTTPSRTQTSKGKQSGEDNVDDDGDDAELHDESVWWTPSELRDILDRSTALKVQGNSEFGKGQWETALATYRDGLVELPVRTKPGVKIVKGEEKQEQDEEEVEDVLNNLDKLKVEDSAESEADEGIKEEEQEVTELRSVLFANVAACCLKLERWRDAVEACDEALEEKPKYMKALHRRALANEQLGTWSSLSSALEDYNTLSTLPDLSPTLKQQIKMAQGRLPPKVKEQQSKEQAEMMGKLKDLGNTVLGKFGLSTDNFKFVEQPGGGYSMNFER